MEIYHPRDEELLREMRRVRRADKRKRLAWGLSILLILSAAAGLFVFHRYYELAVMHGPAMGDSLPEGSVVLVRRTESGVTYPAGSILLYEKQFAEPVDLTILGPKGKIRDYCRYIIYRDVGTTRQYYSTQEGTFHWSESEREADEFETSPEGILHLETDHLPNGDYALKEVYASWGQNLMLDPVPFTVFNPVRTMLKRVLAAPGDRLILSPYQETQVNSRDISHLNTSGRTADAELITRRVIVGNDEYFVQGDQLSLSRDSRDPDYDNVRLEEIQGRAEFALWPLRIFGDLTGASGGREGAGP